MIDWTIHHIINDYGPGGTVNNHTHGMDNYNHLDFQLVLNVKPQEVCRLLNTMGQRVQNGEVFFPGDMVKGLYMDCDVRLDLFKETGRDVFRLIIPDAFNTFPESPDCMEPYKYQTQIMFEKYEKKGFLQ